MTIRVKQSYAGWFPIVSGVAKYWVLLGAVLVFVLTPLAPVHALAVFTERFNDPSLPDWEHSSNATVADGVLRVESGGFAFRPILLGDVDITLRAKLEGKGYLEIQYRRSDPSSYIFRFGDNRVDILRKVDGSIVELTVTEIGISAGEWVDIIIRVEDGRHTITINEEILLSTVDHDPLPPGGLMLRVDGGAVGEFDDLVVKLMGEVHEQEPDKGEPAPSTQVTPAPEAPVARAGVPAYQNLSWVRTGGPLGGLGYDIRYNFDDPNIWYVTDDFTGVHMSTDNGYTWQQSNTGIPGQLPPTGDRIPIFCLTVDPHNPQIIWVGTDFTGRIYKSTDGGYTWVEMAKGVDLNPRPACELGIPILSFRGFTVDPSNSDIVYAMGEIPSAGWTPDCSQRTGLVFDLSQGVVFKTTDGGTTWTEIWRGDNLARYCWVDPHDTNVLYVSTGIFDREAANTDAGAGFAGGVGILKSIDGGKTWRILNEKNGLLDLYVGSLYMHPTKPDVLLAAASNDAWSGYGGEFTGGVYLTEDGGERWEQVLSGELFSTVEFSHFDPDVAYAASSNAVYRSDDGGHTWQRFSRANNNWGPPGIVAGFPIDMQCDPRDPMRIFVNGYLGGNFLSEDGGATWQNASQGYTGAMVRHLAVGRGDPRKVYAGSRSGVFRSQNGGEEWLGLANPPKWIPSKINEILALALDPADSNHVLAAPADLTAVIYTYDGGQSWQHAALPGSRYSPTNLAFAPSDPTIAYAAVANSNCKWMTPISDCYESGTGIWVSRDAGASWSVVTAEQIKDKTVFALSVHPLSPYTVYIATFSSGSSNILKTTDAGQTWTPLGKGLPPLPVLSLTINPSNPKDIFAGLYEGGVYKSTDGGLSWKQSSAGLEPNAMVRSIVIDPTNSQIVYAADALSGIYISQDAGTTWRSINSGLDNRQVNVLALSDNGTVLYAGIEGGGVYRLGTP